MSIFEYIAFGACASLLAFLLKSQKSPVGQLICAVACVIMAVRILGGFAPALGSMAKILEASGFSQYGKTLIKALGVAVVCETAADVCRDLGENSVASKLELAGKLEIVTLSLPLAEKILESARELVAL